MLTGNREIGPMPCSSSAGNEWRNPSRPLPGIELLQGFEFVAHFISASFALILSKFGSSRASSLLSAY